MKRIKGARVRFIYIPSLLRLQRYVYKTKPPQDSTRICVRFYFFNTINLESTNIRRTFAPATETEVGNAGERPTRDKLQSKAYPSEVMDV